MKSFDIRKKARHFSFWRERRLSQQRVKSKTDKASRNDGAEMICSQEPSMVLRFRKNEYPLRDDVDDEAVLIPGARSCRRGE